MLYIHIKPYESELSTALSECKAVARCAIRKTDTAINRIKTVGTHKLRIENTSGRKQNKKPLGLVNCSLHSENRDGDNNTGNLFYSFQSGLSCQSEGKPIAPTSTEGYLARSSFNFVRNVFSGCIASSKYWNTHNCQYSFTGREVDDIIHLPSNRLGSWGLTANLRFHIRL